ncbi:MAG: response regulator transcription factor [Verrucomicrobiota bacterium]
MSSEEKIRLLIIDDHPVVREGLEAMFARSPEVDQIQTASCVAEVEAICPIFQPHIALLDIRMPEIDGFMILQGMQKRWPHIKILILSSSATHAEVKLARLHGASGYLSKSTPRKVLFEALHSIHVGGTCFQAETPQPSSNIPSLSSRELEVLRHLGRGLSNKDLGVAMGVSAETIKGHLKAIFTKIGASTRAEAVTRGYELGLLSNQ